MRSASRTLASTNIKLVEQAQKLNEGSAKVMETRHGLESNPVPIYIDFWSQKGNDGLKMNVATGLDSRPWFDELEPPQTRA